MALLICPDCEGQVSSLASACPHCGRPIEAEDGPDPQEQREDADDGLTPCPRCGRRITPVVTSVGGGSCSIGSREKWTCPSCRRTIHRSGCFIATAAYENEDAVEVQFLREFRDRVLLAAPMGSALVRLYYRTSPRVADLIAHSELLRRSARRVLDGVVVAIEKLTPLAREDVRRRMKTGISGRGERRPERPPGRQLGGLGQQRPDQHDGEV